MTPTPDDSPVATGTNDADTRTVVDFRGEEVEVPAEPERVVTLDLTPTLNLALLGLDPLTAPLDMAP
ncbi:MAG: hypothetical protein ACFCUP_06880, partial [Actinomycetales bacterium]